MRNQPPETCLPRYLPQLCVGAYMIVGVLLATDLIASEQLKDLARPEVTSAISTEEIIQRLSPPNNTPNTRSLRNLKIEPASIDFEISFDFGSPRLRDESKPLLKQIAAAMMSDRLKNELFLIEGHTDRKGSEAFNLRLSEARAKAVLSFLESEGVSTDRLTAIGKGFSIPLDPQDPFSAVNRRVKVSAR